MYLNLLLGIIVKAQFSTLNTCIAFVARMPQALSEISEHSLVTDRHHDRSTAPERLVYRWRLIQALTDPNRGPQLPIIFSNHFMVFCCGSSGLFAVGAGWGCLDIFSLVYHFTFLSSYLWETTRYRLQYCLKGR